MKKWLVLVLYITLHQYNLVLSGEVPLRFMPITDNSGLPHNYVFNIIEDQKGFIWIGTNNGLARYNGYSFKIFQPNPDKKNSLAKKPVNYIHADLRNNIWINFRGIGVNRFDPVKELFTYYEPNTNNKNAISGNQIRKFYEDTDSVLWIVSEKGIDIYDTVKDNFIQILPETITKISTPSNNIYNFFIDKTKKVWFQSSRGIGILDRRTNKVVTLGKITSNPEIDRWQIADMEYDGNNTIYISTKINGLYRYSISENKLTSVKSDLTNIVSSYIDKQGNLYLYSDTPAYLLYKFEKKHITNGSYISYPVFSPPNSISNVRFAEDKSGNIWLGSYQGLEMLSTSGEIVKYRTNIDPYAITGNEIESIFIDNAENLWVSVHRKGICKADIKQKPFKWYTSNPTNPASGLPGNNVTAIALDSHENIWIGCSGDGLTCYSPFDNKYKTYSLPNTSKLNKFGFTSIHEDQFGNIWIGYADDHLDRINPVSGKTDFFSSSLNKENPFYFRGRGVRKIISDFSGNLWMASMIGIIEYNFTTKAFIYHSVLYDKTPELSSFCRVVYQDREGTIWGGSNNGGLIKYNQSKKQFIHYLAQSNDTNSISSNTVYSIFEDNNGTMWIGTSLGLNRFDKSKGTFKHICKKQDFSRYSILSIMPDNTDNLWMSTDNGLFKFNKKTNICVHFNENDGLLSKEFTTTAYASGNDGTIFLGTSKGMISFQPDSIKSNPFPARPAITNLYIFNNLISPGDTLNNRVILNQQISYTKKIILKYKESDITLEFSALHYANPDKNMYRYKMEGFNDKWITTGHNRRYASFTGLQPGNYTFLLKATNNDGIWNPTAGDVKLEIEILPPFRMTLWFKLLMALLLFASVFAYFQIRTFYLKKINAQLEVRVKERTQELNEVNIMLEEKQEEISIQKEELLTQRDSLEQSNEILSEQQVKIKQQNAELDAHRNELELLVEKRTYDLKNALLKAEESDRLKSAFLANMSHEIRTPMNAILGFSSLLQDKMLPEDEKDNYISIIKNSGKSLMVLINDIIDISLIQSNQLDITINNCNVSVLLKELYDVFLLNTQKKNLSLVLNNNSIYNDLIIQTDVHRLKQVFGNLLTNAVKFTQHGTIEFGIYDVNSEIIFYVKDTGIGISEETGDSIFERFMKLDKYEGKIFGGTGLGLAISRSIIEILGGKISYQSEINAGTTFYFTHPTTQLLINNTELKIQEHSKKSDIPDMTGKTILVAEDEEYNYKLIACYLLVTNVNIMWAKNGKEAIEILQQNPVDLVLMDIKMPVMGGLEASKIILKNHPGIPIIAQTAFAYKNEIEVILNSGINEYLIKPINKEDLLKIVKKHIL